MKKKLFLWGGISLGGCVLIAGAILPMILSFAFHADRGYTVHGQDFVYQTPAATATDLSVLAQNLNDRSVTVVYGDEEMTVSGLEIGADYDFDQTAQIIAADFDQKTFWEKFYAGYLPKPEYDLEMILNKKAALTKLWTLNYRSENEAGYPTYKIEGEELVLTPGTGLNVVDEVSVLAEILEELEAQTGKAIVLTPKESVAKQLNVADFKELVEQEPKNAEFSEEIYTVTPHQDGIRVLDDILSVVLDLVPGGEPVRIPVQITAPEITTESLQKKLFRDLLGTYTSKYNPKQIGRSHNVALAASKLNNLIFKDGDEFSYNDLVGQRTIAAGFQYANVYVGNKIEQGVGGGICQVSSALYAAALCANLEIVERVNHSMPVSYMPAGMDATVSYGSIDLKIKNNTGYPIRLEAFAVDGNMTVNIYGTREDDSYDEIVLFYEAVGAIPFTVVEEPTEWLKIGESRIIQNGTNGGKYRVYQQFRKNGQPVKTVLANTSTYQPTPQIVQIGTVPVEEPEIEPTVAPVEPEEPVEVPEEPTPEEEPEEPSEVPEEPEDEPQPEVPEDTEQPTEEVLPPDAEE